MAEPENRATVTGRGLGSTSLLVAALFLLLLYILSTGPVLLVYARVFDDSLRAEGMGAILEIIYFPLSWLYDHCEPVERFYDWYHSLFGL